MKTREEILREKAREIAGRFSVQYGYTPLTEALVDMGRWCDANPIEKNKGVQAAEKSESVVTSMSSHEVARRLLALPDKECMLGCMDDWGAYGLYVINRVEDEDKYIAIGE
ncbi:MAG: hypothetical protein IJ640_00805 [Prevotella sp.]|nr:hypothetical protein [Prevotella sp.]